jgi:hypothetical protein
MKKETSAIFVELEEVAQKYPEQMINFKLDDDKCILHISNKMTFLPIFPKFRNNLIDFFAERGYNFKTMFNMSTSDNKPVLFLLFEKKETP